MKKLFIILGAIAVAGAASAAGKGTIVGPSYTPSGADFSIFAFDGITASNPLGTASNVVLNFEDSPSIGATYTDNKGKDTEFGIGLYQTGSGKNGAAASTGLMVQYNTLVSASSANLTVQDFDINSLSQGFKTGKVEPAMLIYGANNTLLASATPAQILASMTAVGNAKNDIWNINLGSVLSSAHASSSQVSKVLLYADSMNGEKSNSDPYTMVSVGNAQPVPEPMSLIGIASGAVLLIRRRKKTS